MLRDIGQAIGPILRIDTHTTTETRGRFARICVQVNYDNPLIKFIKTGGIEQLVQYEGINSLCFSCGHAGHNVECCSCTTTVPNKGGEDKVQGDEPAAMDHSAPSEDSYRPWVLITRKKQVNRKGNKSSAAYASTQAESPFNPKIDPSGPTEKVWKHPPRPQIKDSAIVADCTNQANEKDITSSLTLQSTSKHHSRHS